MKKVNILAHTVFIGETGYNNHSRSFFTALNKFCNVKVRNFTVGKSWKNYTKTEHNKEFYITDEHKTMLIEQTLLDWDNDKSRSDYPLYNYTDKFKADIHIILSEVNHHYFYDSYDGYKIAYTVWESTKYPANFFNKLLEYDELWVPTEWQRNCSINQGYPPEKVKVVNEAVDIEIFKPEKKRKSDKFKFLLFGRWEYRKSTTEIIKAFSKTFSENEDVELICSIENLYSKDGIKSTKDRLEYYGICHTNNIKIIEFVNRDEYVDYLKQGDVFVSCARSEGWNLPLIEAMACGTPSIYSNWGGQLEFATGKGIPIKIKGLLPANIDPSGVDFPGQYCEPDYDDLSYQMRKIYDEYDNYKIKALLDSDEIRKNFNWDTVAKRAVDILEFSFENKLTKKNTNINRKININFIDGPFAEILENANNTYNIQFINTKNNKIEFETNINSNHWAKCSIKYYIDWVIKIRGITTQFYYEYKFNLKNERVYISFESKSMGDTLASFPYVEEFRKKHECKVICSTFWNKFFEETYREIEFVTPITAVQNLYVMYNIGWFVDSNGNIDYNKNPNDFKPQPIQKTASDILGLKYTEIKPKIKLHDNIQKKNIVSIAIHSTAQAKYWNNPTGWQDVVNYLNKKNYEVVLLSIEDSGYGGNIHPIGIRQLPKLGIDNVIKTLQESKLFIGTSSGLTWLSWAAGTPTILISGLSDVYTEMISNIVGIRTPENKCFACANTHPFDRSDWNWCPEHKGTDRQFECSISITSEMVINSIKTILN